MKRLLRRCVARPLGVFLRAVDDDQVLIEHGRAAKAVLAHPGAEVDRPELVAVVIEGHQAGEVGVGPGDIDTRSRIHGRRDRGEAAVDVQMVRHAGIFAPPVLFPVFELMQRT